MIRSNHYEAAFEAYLQWHRFAYLAIDETRRSFLGDRRIKNLDFVVFGDGATRLLVDVKGRRYPGTSNGRPRRIWECWATAEDIDGLLRWQQTFGENYRGLFVFAYQLTTEEPPPLAGDLWTWQGRRYLLRGIWTDDYAGAMRRRSPSWDTVYLTHRDFLALSRPFGEFLEDAEAPVPF